MLEIGNTLVSEIIFERKFLCDLEACKGACCVHGDSGAPLEKEETIYLQENLEKIKPYLTKEGIKVLEKEGVSVIDGDGDEVTPLIKGAECAFTVFDKNGLASCGIEKAYEDKAIDFKKPISCHLYPIRISKIANMEAINYSKWDLCDPACKLGELKGLKVFRFLKEALIRKYGLEYYNTLEEVDKALDKIKK